MDPTEKYVGLARNFATQIAKRYPGQDIDEVYSDALLGVAQALSNKQEQYSPQQLTEYVKKWMKRSVVKGIKSRASLPASIDDAGAIVDEHHVSFDVDDYPGLSPLQKTILQTMSEGGSMLDAAKAAGVSDSTARRAFKAAVKEIRNGEN